MAAVVPTAADTSCFANKPTKYDGFKSIATPVAEVAMVVSDAALSVADVASNFKLVCRLLMS
jgi:hypothetical protein